MWNDYKHEKNTAFFIVYNYDNLSSLIVWRYCKNKNRQSVGSGMYLCRSIREQRFIQYESIRDRMNKLNDMVMTI